MSLGSTGRTLTRRLGRVGSAYTGVIRSRSYFPLWLGQLVSNFGDTLHYIALVVLVFRLTGHGIGVAGLVVAEIVPVLVLGPIAGVAIDRFSRKGVLVAADIGRALLVLSLVWPQGAWHAYLVAGGLAAGSTFFNPAVQAVIPTVSTEDQRLAANSVAWSTTQAVQIIAAAVAGGVIALFGTRVAFGLNGASFLVSAALILTLPIPRHAGQLDEGATTGFPGYLDAARAGLRFARRDTFVSRLLVVQALASFATGATGALLVVLSEQFLHLPPAGFAWLIGAIGVGALVGPLIPNSVADDYRDARWLFVPYIIRGVGDILMAVLRPLPLALCLQFIYGLNTSTGMVVFNSTVQGAVPDAMRGRVFTLLDITWSAMQLVSLVAGGLLVDAVGIRPLFWVAGTLLIVSGVLGLALLGRYDFRAVSGQGQALLPGQSPL
jgi:MFS family permease